MNIHDYLTPEQREQGYPMIRQEAVEVLVPKPWKHTMVVEYGQRRCWHCCKAGVNEGDPCDAPPCILNDAGQVASIIEIAESLVRKVPIPDLVKAIGDYKDIRPIEDYCKLALAYELFIKALPAERAAIALTALKGEKS